MGYLVVTMYPVHLVNMGYASVNVRSDTVILGVETTLNAVGAAASMVAIISVYISLKNWQRY